VNIVNIYGWTTRFEVLQTTSRIQTGVMRLERGEASGPTPELHPHSDQVVLLLMGELTAELGEETEALSAGASLVIPAGVPHRLINPGDEPALIYTCYASPAYSPGGDAEA
jgi:HTH-type transcriptional repressor of puuD